MGRLGLRQPGIYQNDAISLGYSAMATTKSTPNFEVVTEVKEKLGASGDIEQSKPVQQGLKYQQDFGTSPTASVCRVYGEDTGCSGTSDEDSTGSSGYGRTSAGASRSVHRRSGGQKRNDRRRSKRENSDRITAQLKSQLQDVQGDRDALREIKREVKSEVPNKPIETGVRAVDYLYTGLDVPEFTATSERLGWLQSRLMSFDGVGSDRLKLHTWYHVSMMPPDQPLDIDQRVVSSMSYDMYKRDPQMHLYSVLRRWRWSRRLESILSDEVHRPTAESCVDAVVSWTMATCMIARDGPRMLSTCDEVHLESRYDQLSVGVNLPADAVSLRDDTLAFVRDFCIYLCEQTQRRADSETPYFHSAPLIPRVTLSHSVTAGANVKWGITNLFEQTVSCVEATRVLGLIFLVFLWDAILTGPRAPLRTLLILEHWSAACANVLVAPARSLINLCCVGSVLLFGTGCDIIWFLCRRPSTLLLLIGCVAQITLAGVVSRSTINLYVTTAFYCLVTLPVVVSSSVRAISTMMSRLKKLVLSIPEVMSLKRSLDQYLVQLSELSMLSNHSLNMSQWPIVRRMLCVRFTHQGRIISPRITHLLKRIFTLILSEPVKVSCIVICCVTLLTGANLPGLLSRVLPVSTLFGLVRLLLGFAVVVCRVICAHLWAMVSLILCSCYSLVV